MVLQTPTNMLGTSCSREVSWSRRCPAAAAPLPWLWQPALPPNPLISSSGGALHAESIRTSALTATSLDRSSHCRPSLCLSSTWASSPWRALPLLSWQIFQRTQWASGTSCFMFVLLTGWWLIPPPSEDPIMSFPGSCWRWDSLVILLNWCFPSSIQVQRLYHGGQNHDDYCPRRSSIDHDTKADFFNFLI